MRTLGLGRLFPLGCVLATPGAIDLLDRTGTNADDLLRRHQSGDWGVICSSDARSNDLAVANGTRLLSTYELGDGREKLWPDADRQATTIMRASEY